MESKVMYDMNPHIPEIYDQEETQTHDVLFYLETIKTINGVHILNIYNGTKNRTPFIKGAPRATFVPQKGDKNE